jgi:hypothetical protein
MTWLLVNFSNALLQGKFNYQKHLKGDYFSFCKKRTRMNAKWRERLVLEDECNIFPISMNM